MKTLLSIKDFMVTTWTHTHTVNALFDQSILQYSNRMFTQWTGDTTISLWLRTPSNNPVQSLHFILKTQLSFNKAASQLENLTALAPFHFRLKKLCLHFKNSTSISTE